MIVPAFSGTAIVVRFPIGTHKGSKISASIVHRETEIEARMEENCSSSPYPCHRNDLRQPHCYDNLSVVRSFFNVSNCLSNVERRP